MINGRVLQVLLSSILLGLLTFLNPQAAIAENLPMNPGVLHHPISTDSTLAQRYFDRALLLTYGFNHAEALRLYEVAAKLDPNCAMCYWGMAYVLGPNINAAMDTEMVTSAWDAIEKATTLSEQTSPAEKAYIQALTQRYSPSPVSDRTALNLAYADAMRQVVQQYPNDLDAATLFAEALMDTTPWKYWEENSELNPIGREVISTLESVLQRDPNHPGALHFYIHAVEAKHPEWASAIADRLRELHLPMGHMVHMPSHIYIRVGRYQDAVTVNQQAIILDRQYAQRHPPAGIYTYAYMPHNPHLLWYAATQAGQQAIALQAASHTAAMVNPELARQPGYGTLQHYLALPFYTWIQFGLWDEILAASPPPADLVYPTGVWHYARGMALVGKNQLPSAAQELEQLRATATSPALEGVTLWEINTTSNLLQIASQVLAGKLAAKQGDFEAGIHSLQQAVALEDHLNYDEPAPWHFPVRRSLAGVLLQAGRPAEAEQVYREDLAIYPDNGWSLYGLAKSLNAQGKTETAKQVEQQFQMAWKQADINLQDLLISTID